MRTSLKAKLHRRCLRRSPIEQNKLDAASTLRMRTTTSRSRYLDDAAGRESQREAVREGTRQLRQWHEAGQPSRDVPHAG